MLPAPGLRLDSMCIGLTIWLDRSEEGWSSSSGSRAGVEESKRQESPQDRSELTESEQPESMSLVHRLTVFPSTNICAT
jgi:hypothetical protein